MMFRKLSGLLTQVHPDEEAKIRAALVPDGSSGPLLENHGPFDVVLSDEEAAEQRAQWAAHVPTVPDCEAWQLQVELLERGRLEEAVSVIEQVGGEARIRWHNSRRYMRAHPAWNDCGARMNPPLSPADIDAIFTAASKRA